MSKDDWKLNKKEDKTYFLKNKWDSNSSKEITYDKYSNRETTYKRTGQITKKYRSGSWF